MQKNTKDLAKKKAIVENVAQKSKKDVENNINKTVKKSTNSAKKTAISNTEKNSSDKKNTAKKSSVSVNNTAKKSTTKKNTKSTTSKNSASKVKKSSTATTTKSAKTKKTNTSKKSTAAKKRTTTKKNATLRKTKKAEIIEYYDLPYRYNQTVVKILAQTPNTLFVYWDIADADRKKFEEQYGKNFFESTFPVLIVHNKTMNYSFEIEINDFANSWYFNVNDAKCDYEIELGRRSRHYSVSLPDNYMHVASSNKIEAPNNRILFEKNQKTLFFRNVKNNNRISKDISQFQFIQYIGRIYNIYDIYKKIYKHEELQDLENNPSSGF